MTAANNALPLTEEECASVFSSLSDQTAVALALSGGPDSMALGYCLSCWAAANKGPAIHALTVDHGLRAESTHEAREVAQWVKTWPHVEHHILAWDGEKPGSRVMEEARRARYKLMQDYCLQHGMTMLLTAHHQDDQAETLLMRLAAGSGLDGLAGMKAQQQLDGDLVLMRPFLPFAKERLIATCNENSVPFVNDPSNEKEHYMRPRLRAARDVLEQEGLSNKRLSVTAARLARARNALEEMTQRAFEVCVTPDKDGYKIDRIGFFEWPEEIRLRLILRIIDTINPDRDYAPRMEKVEELLRVLFSKEFRGRTLGGCVFAIGQGDQALWVSKE